MGNLKTKLIFEHRESFLLKIVKKDNVKVLISLSVGDTTGHGLLSAIGFAPVAGSFAAIAL